MKKWGMVFLKIAVTTGLLVWLLRSLNLAQAASQLSRAKPAYLILTLLIIWFGHFLCVLRWKLLLAALEIPMRTLGLVLIYGIGMFFNLVFPGLIGGDLVKIYLTSRDSGRPYALSFASIFLDRDVGFVAMILIAVIAAALHPINVQGYSLELCFLGLLAVCVLINLALFHPGAHKLALRFLRSGRLSGIIHKFNRLFDAFTRARRRPGSLAAALALSLVNQFIVIISSWLIALSLGISAPFRYFMVFVPATVVITMIPISINGVGLREFAYMSFFSTIGVSQEEGVLMGFLSSILIVVSGLPGSIAYLLHKKEVRVEVLSAYQDELARDTQAP